MRRCGATAWRGTDGWLRYRGGSERTRRDRSAKYQVRVSPVSRRRTGRRLGVNSEFVTGPSGRPATVWVRPLVTAGSFSRIWVSCIRVGGRARNTRWTWCPKDRPDIVVDVADVIDVIVRVAGTGKIGDGKGMGTTPIGNRGPGPRQRARPGSPVGPCRQTPVVTAGGSLTANARSITSSVARGRAVDRHIMWRTDQTGAAMLPIGQSAAAAASRAPGAAGGRAGYGSPIPRVVVVEGGGECGQWISTTGRNVGTSRGAGERGSAGSGWRCVAVGGLAWSMRRRGWG